MFSSRQIRRLLFAAACFALTVPAAAAPGDDDPTRPRAPQRQREDYLRRYTELAEAVTQIELNFAQPIDRDRLFDAALRGMLAELDPYSAYLPEERFAELRAIAESTRPSTGVELAIEQGRMVVLGVRPGSPAESAGVRPGEPVLQINGRPTEGASLTQADQQLLSAGGATLLVGDPPREVRLAGKRLSAPTVNGAQTDGQGVVYVRVASFNADTAADLSRAVADGLADGGRALIVDLRFNPGGLLEAAVDVADLFLERGEIVRVVSRHGEPRVLSATAGDVASAAPVALLVNRYSASASEVVAAALQDAGRAVVVGERTFGKGSVQSLVPLGDGQSGLKLTTATYRRPSGRNIHRFPSAGPAEEWGVSPDEGASLALTGPQSAGLLSAWKSGDPPPEDPQLELAKRLLLERLAGDNP